MNARLLLLPIITFFAICFLLNGCTKRPVTATSTPGPEPFKGEVYRSIDERTVITLISPDELEIRNSGTNLICKYTKQAEALRIVANVFGTTQAIYYKVTPEGLVGEDATVLYEPLHFDKRKKQIKLNQGLLEAAKIGDARSIESLFEQGAQTGMTDSLGNGALTLAVGSGNEAAVTSILNHGGNPNEPNTNGRLPLQEAIASKAPNPTIVNVLLEKGADPNGSNGIQMSPLLLAAASNNPVCMRIVQLLCEHRVNLNVRAPNGDTALIIAFLGHRDQVVRLLVEAGADKHIGGRGFPPDARIFEMAGNIEELSWLYTKAENEERSRKAAEFSKLLLGVWRNSSGLVQYNADGTLSMNYNASPDEGKWRISGDSLEIGLSNGQKGLSKIKELTGSHYVIIENGREWRAERVK